MAKKKNMTPAQAAAARRPDDWEPPQPSKKELERAEAKAAMKKAESVNVSRRGLFQSLKDNDMLKVGIPFIILFVVMAMITPFIIIGVNSLFN